MRLACILSLVATGAVAQDCPTAEDLDDGIRLTRVDPYFSVVMTRDEDDLSEARVMTRDGLPEAVSTRYAHALTVTHREGAGGTLSLDYARDTSGLDQLPGPRSWSSAVTLRTGDEVLNTGTYTAQLSGLGKAEIGECSYTVWRVNEVLQLDGMAPMTFEKSYAPDLGLVLGSIQLDPQGAPLGSVFFDEITAE
ncbi:MAG: hypothetical protein GVY31_07260 [Alphaproteobacteria bacterium]|jgi:hypothetical protein|nr:hypothetical protein [Alphaproteobacteria bacterium]